MPIIVDSVRRWLAVGCLGSLGLLTAGCCFCPGPIDFAPPNLNPGVPPLSSAVFCDIEPPLLGRHCASPDEVAQGVRLADGAVALNNGSTSAIAIDDSPAALAACGGTPQAVQFYGAFPDGYASCVNATDIGPAGNYANSDALCAAQCEDFFGETSSDGTFMPDDPPDPGIAAWCQGHAHASTNYPQMPLTSTLSFAGACSDFGTLSPGFADPRRAPEPVEWENLVGASASGSTLIKTAMTAGFDAGGVSMQTIDAADGFVDFTVPDATTAEIGGLTSGPPGSDTDPGVGTLNFGVGLALDGTLFVFENGEQIGPFGAYAAGDRFRVTVHDRFDGTATVTYSRVFGTCIPGEACNEQVFYTSTATGAYPFHVDASLFEPGASLANVQLVRMHQ